VREPLGARASAIYSIAQRMDSRERKFFHYHQVVMLSTQAVARDVTGENGALLIRAHALMQMARLGHFWKLWEATKDFRKCLEIRNTSGAAPAGIGEVKTDLGFCYVLSGRRRRGMALLQEGVALMRCDKTANGKAFLARGLRKLEHAATLSGARRITHEARCERLSLSAAVEALDQAREP
jgi:hypothetical protein